MFKRFGFVKKTLAPARTINAGEVLATNAGKSLAIPSGTALKMGERGLVKVGKSEVAVYNRTFKGRKGFLAARRARMGAVSEAQIIKEGVVKGGRFNKLKPLLMKTGEIALGAAGWYAVDALLDYAFDKNAEIGEAASQVAAEDAARDAISTMTKLHSLEDSLNSAGGSRSRRDGSTSDSYYNGPELSDQADLIKRLMLDLGLTANGEVSSAMDQANMTSAGHYERADLILRLVTIIKALANNSNASEFYNLLARQAVCSSLDSVAWTESFERLVKLDEVEMTAVEAISSEYNALYEGLFEEHRIDVADKYFNEVTELFNFKSDRSTDFSENELSSDGVVAKRRFALSSMVTDDSFADVEGWWDRLKVDADNAKDDEYLAAQEMIRYSTMGSDFIAAFTAAVNSDSFRRRNILARG